MSESALPMVMVIGMSTIVAASLLLLGWLLGRPERSGVDRTPYECGMSPFERTETNRFSVHFYLVAMLFILFDVEAAFLLPWAVTFGSFSEQKTFVLGEMVVFLAILVAGFVYLWKRGALEWD